MNRASTALTVGRPAGCSVLAALALTLSGCQQLQSLVHQPPPGPSNVGLSYTNPLSVTAPTGRVESCPDPSIIRGQRPTARAWYIYCTGNPHNAADLDAAGKPQAHLMSMLKSDDLVHWNFIGDVLSRRPEWAYPDSGLWAPDIEFLNGKYFLYYSVPDTKTTLTDNGRAMAIGVATSESPAGPWTDSGQPVVEPHYASCRNCAEQRRTRWAIDPDVVADDAGQLWIFYGSYFGGISARKLSNDGLHSDPASQVQITTFDRYEAANVVKHGEYYYLFASATNCCNGPVTGYSVFVGRSKSVTGPYLDREGVSLLNARVGGTPVLSMNGNRFVGPGHSALFTDTAGQDWLVYHAIDMNDPSLNGAGDGKRPVMMDPVDWVDGWPTVRGGRWASDTPQPAPAARDGDRNLHTLQPAAQDQPGALDAGRSDDFDGAALGARWTWVRPPADPATFGVGGGQLTFQTQNADLFEKTNSASVLTEPAPASNYLVEVKVTLPVPTQEAFSTTENQHHNYHQAGVTIYKDDDNFIKLAPVSIWDTRQVEFAKEESPAPAANRDPIYGNTVIGPEADTLWLRIAKRDVDGQERYTAYSSRDGVSWTRGGTWTHHLGGQARIGLVSMGGTDGDHVQATFDYVHVYGLR